MSFITRDFHLRLSCNGVHQCIAPVTGSHNQFAQIATYRPPDSPVIGGASRPAPMLTVTQGLESDLLDHVVVTAILLEREREAQVETSTSKRSMLGHNGRSLV